MINNFFSRKRTENLYPDTVTELAGINNTYINIQVENVGL